MLSKRNHGNQILILDFPRLDYVLDAEAIDLKSEEKFLLEDFPARIEEKTVTNFVHHLIQEGQSHAILCGGAKKREGLRIKKLLGPDFDTSFFQFHSSLENYDLYLTKNHQVDQIDSKRPKSYELTKIEEKSHLFLKSDFFILSSDVVTDQNSQAYQEVMRMVHMANEQSCPVILYMKANSLERQMCQSSYLSSFIKNYVNILCIDQWTLPLLCSSQRSHLALDLLSQMCDLTFFVTGHFFYLAAYTEEEERKITFRDLWESEIEEFNKFELSQFKWKKDCHRPFSVRTFQKMPFNMMDPSYKLYPKSFSFFLSELLKSRELNTPLNLYHFGLRIKESLEKEFKALPQMNWEDQESLLRREILEEDQLSGFLPTPPQ